MTMGSKLPPHEWIIIGLLITTLSLLTFITFFNKQDPLPQSYAPVELTSELIQVTIKGEVTHSGIHELKKGTRLKDLLALAIPSKDADLTRLKLNAKLRDGQVIRVSAFEWITVHLEGAIQEKGPLKVLKGTKLQDLLEKVVFLPDADVSKLKKKRLLKDEEVIIVSLKKSKARKKVTG